MKDEYVLYLDESEIQSKKFAIAGFAIKKSNISNIEQSLCALKEMVWGKEYVINNVPVVHCTELTKVYNKRKKAGIPDGLSAPFALLAQKSSDEIETIYTQVFASLSRIIRTHDVTIFSCTVDVNELNKLFYMDETHNGIHMIDDKYNIALQKIIESYTHFLCCQDGYGDIIYESRNTTGENSQNSPDVKLINNYHQVHANNRGIVFTSDKTIQERNRTITTYGKSDDIAGLQLADFIANNILKFQSIKEASQVTDFMKQLHRFSYNGGYSVEQKDHRNFWGMRIIPSFPKVSKLEAEIVSLTAEIKKLRAANKKLRNERNKLNRKLTCSSSDTVECETQCLEVKDSSMDNATNEVFPNTFTNSSL